MSSNRAVRSSQKSKQTKSAVSSKQSKSRNNYKTRDKPKYKSGAKPKNRSRDSATTQTKRRPSNRSRSKSRYSSKSSSASQARRRPTSRSGERQNYRSEGGFKQLYKTTCSNCKKETKVPFKPTGNKPVYCRDCFQERKSRNGHKSSRIQQSRPKQLHTVMCASCGDETSVPFRPSGVKPVYCRNCFQEQKSKERSESTKFKKNTRQASQYRRSPKRSTKNTSKKKSSTKTVERFGDRSGPYRSNKKMHQTSCRSCNKEITVPFKPTATKSIYCQDCFQKVEKK